MNSRGEHERTTPPPFLRILHINSAQTWRGGEQQTLWLCRGLQQRGHHIVLACPPGSPLMERARQAGLFVCPVRMRGEWDLLAVRDLFHLIRQRDIQIAHFHTAHAHTLGLLAAQWTGVPGRFLTRRVDFHIHRHPLNRWKYGSALTSVVAISDGIRRVLLEDGLPPAQVVTVRSGIDLNRIANVKDPSYLQKEFQFFDENLVIGIVAALAAHKDHRNFLQAAALVKQKVPNARFLVVGDGPLRAELIRLAQGLDLSRDVAFIGFRDDVLEITKFLDIFVLSSYLEGMGTALLDAMALGRPVVATEVGGIPEIVRTGENGLLVPPRDPAALAEAIVKLATSPELRQRMGLSGEKQARDYGVERVVLETEKVYYRFGPFPRS